MRVPKQKHNASSKQVPQYSVVGGSRRPGKSYQQSQLVQTLSRVGNAANAGNHAALLNRAPGSQQPANKNLLLHLQRQYGNSYVNQVVTQARQNGGTSSQQPPLQTKLTIGPVGDKYEREADRTAAAVVQRINSPSAVQSAGSEAIQREKMPEEEVQKKPQITAIQREVMPGEDEQQAQMKPAVELVQTKKPDEEDKQKQAAKKTALAAPPQPKKIKEEDKKKLLRKKAASNHSKSKKEEEDEKLKHLQKKSDTHAEHGQKEEDEDKLPIQKKFHPDAGSTKKPEEEDKLNHLQKKSDTHVEHGQKEEDEDKLSVQKKSHPGADPHKQPEDDDKHLMQAKSEVSAGHQDKDEEDKMAQMQPLVQRRSGEGGTDATTDVESAIKHARGKGKPLPDPVRSSMENAFGADFSGVKIHADTHADKLNRSIQARAFTTGQDVFFRHGEFALGSKRGQELLAHELTHVVQQNGNAVQPKSLPKQENNKKNKLQSKTKHNESAEPAVITEQKVQGRSNHLAPTAASADTSGFSDVQQQPLVAEAGIAEFQVQRQEAAGDAAPDSPEADQAYQEVVSQAQEVGTKEKEHQPAEEKSQEAQAAAEPPSNEVESKAQDKQVDEMEAAPTPPFDAKAFKEALMKRIADITPKNLEEADQFKNSNKLESVKNDVTGKVGEEQKDSQGPLEEKTKAPPDASGITPKPVTPLPPNQPGETPSINGAEKAAPKSKGQSEVEAPAQARSQSLDQQLAEADITEEQLAKSNEPQFQAALDSKKTAQTHSQTAPQTYRQGEQSQLSQAESTAAATTQEKLQGMHGERSQSLEQVTGKQEEGKSKDEQSRAKIAGDIDKIYQTTKTKVDTKLAKLTTDVSDAFDAGAAEARKVFEEYVGKRMDDYKEDRYGLRWNNLLGPAKWIHDKLWGMPDEVNRFYEEGRDLYLKYMDGVIDKVVAIVGTGLTEAKNDVADGRKQVKEYVAKLPEDLKEIGVEAAENIQTQFDGLEQEIDNKQDELIDTLAQKYKENLDAIDTRIKEMQEENKGLIQKAIDFIVGVIKTIIELAKMLLEVLARVASVIGGILKDPIGFLSNLFNALKLGFNNFVKNIGKYLMQGLLSWLTGALAGANIQMPTSLDSQGIFSLVIQVLGVGYDAIRAKAVKRMGKDGESKVSHLEKSFEMFRILATQGVAGVWQVIKERLGDIKSMVLDPIMQFLIENVIVAGVQWIIGLMSPASAFIKACKAIYDIIKFFIEHAQQIADLINSILDAVSLVASGAIDKAAQAVEDSLAKAIPVAIDFLARILGLGNISGKVQAIIQKMRQPIDKAIDWVIDQGVKAYKKVSNKFKQSKLGKKIKATKATARKKKEAAEKWIKNKKEAVDKRYEREKNKLLKSKAGKKQLDALKKKRDAANKKIDAIKNEFTKKPGIWERKDKKHRGISDKQKYAQKAKSGSAAINRKDNKKKQESQKAEHDRKVKAGLAAIDREETKYLKQGKITREGSEKVVATVKRQHPIFKKLIVIDGGTTWDYNYVASPPKKKYGEKKAERKIPILKPKSGGAGKRTITIVPGEVSDVAKRIRELLNECDSYLAREKKELNELKTQGDIKVELNDEKTLEKFTNRYSKLKNEEREKTKYISQKKRNPKAARDAEKFRKEVMNFLAELQKHYGEFTSGGGSHMRKHPDARGMIVYYGDFQVPSDDEFRHIEKKKLQHKTHFKLFLGANPGYYRLTYIKASTFGVDNAVYYPKQIETPEGILTGQKDNEKLNVDKVSEKADPKKKEDFKKIADKLDKDLSPPERQTKVYTAQARRKDRGGGQIQAMNKTNAAAYAYGKEITGALEKNWEWLHIQGAGLGGETASTNLVAGTYSANSHMIPFEGQIKALSTLANSDHPLNVAWKIEMGGKGKFHCKKITIEWYAKKGLILDANSRTEPIPDNDPMVVEFDPERATVFDKYQSKAAWKTYKKYIETQSMITD
ncbi:DUF4157 domain-containing protein [Tolypothrix sp. FACHB-123]|uniref:eCIS core domain-containing protein n=1 Tax=Tolypothrix sp. FACHB-123 TaxID=2692868 RepID=UPI001683F49C|nr:DUF4157 domain-containing protein [Tolypothrix sp. FACHB-123]MBD2358718.1 DUF4157 domain-containing protein [Tolypothrix sp. FACHB-123]